MGAQGIVETNPFRVLTSHFGPSCHYGQSYEGNEGHGSHEGHESNEEEVRDCKGPHGQSRRLSWIQGEDFRWLEADRLGEELAWKDREQEAIGIGQEEILHRSQALDYRSPEGKEGTWCKGLRRYQEGLSSLQQSQGLLQLSISAWLHLRLWGYLHPSSAVASDWISFVEHLR